MKPQRILTWILWLWIPMAWCPAFVHGIDTAPTGSSILGETGGKPEMSRSVSPPGRDSTEGRRSKVTVYYFHRKVRCDGCLAIEKLSKKTVDKEFPEPLKTGRLDFRTVLLDDKENWHYVDEFLLTGPSLVIAETRDGRTVRWKNADKVWDLLGSESDFSAYVGRVIEEFLE